jgi:hypothetical protein
LEALDPDVAIDVEMSRAQGEGMTLNGRRTHQSA